MKSLTLIDKAFLLKKSPLFGSLDLDVLFTISDKMEMACFKKGSTIFQHNEEAHQMYLIVTGSVIIYDKQKNVLAELSRGEFFGDEAIFNEKPRSYQAFSKSSLSLLTLSRSHLLNIIIEYPSVAIALLEAYTAAIPFRKKEIL